GREGNAPKRRGRALPRNRHGPHVRHWPWQSTWGPAFTRLMHVIPHGLSQVTRATAATPRAAVTMTRRWPTAWATRPPARRLTASASRCLRPFHPEASEARPSSGTARRPTTRETTSTGGAPSPGQANARGPVPRLGHGCRDRHP